MSKIDELIAELCLDGVEFKPLGEMCSFNRGKWIKAALLTPGNIPVVTSSQKINDYHNEFNREGETVVISSSGAYAGYVSYWDKPIYLSNAFSVDAKNQRLLSKYIYYFLKNMQRRLHELANGAGVPNIYGKDIENIKIPIPPLEVQREIVRILDSFTELETELEAELEARKKQYDFYRNYLLKLDTSGSVDHMMVGDICKLVRGKRLVKSELEEEGQYAVYQNSMTPLGYYDKSNFSGDTTFIISAGAAGEIGYSPTDFWAADDVYVLQPSESVKSRFLYHALENQKRLLSTKVRRASIPRLSRISIEKLSIPVPSLEQQDRIVTILDQFDALVNDISSGIPAEINARRKQYEYYRNKLLTFKELAA